MTHQTCVRLSDDTYGRLKALANETGRSATYYIREALEEHLDDLEDIYLAEQALRRLNRGEERTYTLSELEQGIDLVD